MKRLHIQCLAFNTADFVFEAISLFEKQKGNYPIVSKVLYNPKYPLSEEPKHSARLMEIAENFGFEYVEIENLGVSENWNQAIKNKFLSDGDVLVGIDPDERPQQVGWLDSLMEVFNNEPGAYYVGLNQKGNPSNCTEMKFGNTIALKYSQLIAWPVGGFDCGWLEKIGGASQDHPVYGYIEHSISRKASALGGNFYILKDFFDIHQESPDDLLGKWKRECAAIKTNLTFEGWLNARR